MSNNTVTILVKESTVIEILQGSPGADGVDGTNGTNGAAGADGLGVPAGGTTGQVLAKASDTDNDTEWVDQSGGGGGGGLYAPTIQLAGTKTGNFVGPGIVSSGGVDPISASSLLTDRPAFTLFIPPIDIEVDQIALYVSTGISDVDIQLFVGIEDPIGTLTIVKETALLDASSTGDLTETWDYTLLANTRYFVGAVASANINVYTFVPENQIGYGVPYVNSQVSEAMFRPTGIAPGSLPTTFNLATTLSIVGSSPNVLFRMV